VKVNQLDYQLAHDLAIKLGAHAAADPVAADLLLRLSEALGADPATRDWAPAVLLATSAQARAYLVGRV
jgi:hypothetical protein